MNTPMIKRKAVSPVIATVILVAVAISVAVGVSYWMGGISSQYTQFEKVEIQTGFATLEANGWVIALTLKNSGAATATITHVFLNEEPVDVYEVTPPPPDWIIAWGEVGAGNTGTDLPVAGTTLTAGESGTIYVLVSNGGTTTLSSGTTVNVKLHSAGGMDYIKLIRLT